MKTRTTSGFSLIELMVAIVILGLLASLSMSGFRSFRDHARRAACLEQQHGLRTAAVMYGVDHAIDTARINVGVLISTGYIAEGIAECPSSNVVDNDDFDVYFVNGTISRIVCTFKNDDHAL